METAFQQRLGNFRKSKATAYKVHFKPGDEPQKERPRTMKLFNVEKAVKNFALQLVYN